MVAIDIDNVVAMRTVELLVDDGCPEPSLNHCPTTEWVDCFVKGLLWWCVKPLACSALGGEVEVCCELVVVGPRSGF